MARAFPPLPFQKRDNGAEVPFHHRCRSRQIFGVRRILPEFRQTCAKSFLCNFCLQIFFHKDWCNLQNKVFMSFSANLGRHVLKPNNVGRQFYLDFQGFCQDFQQIKTFGGPLATPSPPFPTPLLFITVS